MCLYVVIFMHLYAICVLPVDIALPYQTSIFLSCFVVVNKEIFFIVVYIQSSAATGHVYL